MIEDVLRLALAALIGGVAGAVGTTLGAIKPLRRELHALAIVVAKLEERISAVRPQVVVVSEERRKHSRERTT